LRRYGFADKNSATAALAISDDTARVSGHTLLSFVMLNQWLEQSHGNHC
jgi:hypothetical protein